MGTFRNIKCMMRKEPFADVENINSIEIAVLEIAMNPEVRGLQRTDKRWEMGDGRWGMGDGGWVMGDGGWGMGDG